MVDYHKKYLKYKQKHLMSKMNTFTGGAQVTTISSIEEVVTKAAPGKKIIDPHGILTTLTQMRFKETQNDNCNNIATLIKQVPCLSVKFNSKKDGFELESTDDVVILVKKDQDVDIMIGNTPHKGKINDGKITSITDTSDKAIDALNPVEYKITLKQDHLQIAETNMHTGKALDTCTITFDIVQDKVQVQGLSGSTVQPENKIDYNSVKLDIK